jgi:type IV secretion system protein TrbL
VNNFLNPGIMDRIALALHATLNLGWTGLTPGVLWILSVVSTIYLVGTLFIAMAGMLDVLPQICMRVAVFMGFVWVITNFQGLTEMIANVSAAVGLMVSKSDMTVTEFALPGRVLWQGQTLLQALIDHVNQLSWLDYGKNFAAIQIMVVAMYLSWICFFITALHMLYVQITFKIVALMSLPKIAFGIWKGSAFLAREGVDVILSQAMRLMTLALVIGMTRHMLLWLAFPPGEKPGYWSALSMLAGAGTLMTLSLAGPRAAATHGGALLGLLAGAAFGAVRGISWLRR